MGRLKNVFEGKNFDRWTGTERAMLTKHPDKFSKEACNGKDSGKLCPYAITASMEKKGATPHYEKLPSSLKGSPVKKEEQTLWERWVALKECDGKGAHAKTCRCKNCNKEKKTMACECSCDGCKDGDCGKCSCDGCTCKGCSCKN